MSLILAGSTILLSACNNKNGDKKTQSEKITKVCLLLHKKKQNTKKTILQKF